MKKIISLKKSIILGTGKSFLLHRIVSLLKHIYPDGKIALTAPTGIAAINIDSEALHSTTIHSFADLRVDDTAEKYLKRVEELRQQSIKGGDRLGRRWLECNAIIIDEISMVSSKLFDILETIARTLRDPTKPWGGMHVIATGDFYQLPPINAPYAFNAVSWYQTFAKNILLTQVRRQADAKFAALLSALHVGNLTSEVKEAIWKLSRPLTMPDPKLLPVCLVATRKEAEKINNSHLRNLPGVSHVYPAEDVGNSNDIDKFCRYPTTLEVREGALVVCLRNWGAGSPVVNGSTGIIIGFTTKEPVFPIVRFDCGVEMAIGPETWERKSSKLSRIQLPLLLSWAITIHSSQGLTISKLFVDLSKMFAMGHAYVALSRAVDEGGLQVVNCNFSQIKRNAEVDNFYKNLIQ